MTKTLQIAIVRADRSDLAIGLDQQGERGLWLLSDGAPKFLCPVSEQDGLFFAIAADALGVGTCALPPRGGLWVHWACIMVGSGILRPLARTRGRDSGPVAMRN